ncbi:MAG: site-2 protease family protein [Halobacteria archaeon]|nr:site-2 protease family protein [Halobacteria archaeon]
MDSETPITSQNPRQPSVSHPSDDPDRDDLLTQVGRVFDVYEVRQLEDGYKFYGDPLVDTETLYKTLYTRFRDLGYSLELDTEYGENVVIAEEPDDSFPWTNLVLALATFVTTLVAGSLWYSANPVENPASVLRGLPFALSVMTVLGAHEFGHYLMSRYHGVDATLPYFIPFPSIIGTMGAVIRVKGVIPDRKALFDIGVAGPLLGLVATLGVTAVGLTLHPVTNTVPVQLHYPPLYDLIKSFVPTSPALDQPEVIPNPVVIGGWVGMFVTFLNLIPAGQLDGGHILKSVLGDASRFVSRAVPVVLFGLGAYVEYVRGLPGTVWFVWGVFSLLVTVAGGARLIDDSGRVGWKRTALAVVVFALGLLSFTPVPVTLP